VVFNSLVLKLIQACRVCSRNAEAFPSCLNLFDRSCCHS
jgi:hypothetical protein